MSCGSKVSDKLRVGQTKCLIVTVGQMKYFKRVSDKRHVGLVQCRTNEIDDLKKGSFVRIRTFCRTSEMSDY